MLIKLIVSESLSALTNLMQCCQKSPSPLTRPFWILATKKPSVFLLGNTLIALFIELSSPSLNAGIDSFISKLISNNLIFKFSRAHCKTISFSSPKWQNWVQEANAPLPIAVFSVFLRCCQKISVLNCHIRKIFEIGDLNEYSVF